MANKFPEGLSRGRRHPPKTRQHRHELQHHLAPRRVDAAFASRKRFLALLSSVLEVRAKHMESMANFEKNDVKNNTFLALISGVFGPAPDPPESNK